MPIRPPGCTGSTRGPGVTSQLSRDALHAQLASALDAVVHVVRGAGGMRRVAEISIFVRDLSSGLVRSECALEFHADGRTVRGPASGKLERMEDR